MYHHLENVQLQLGLSVDGSALTGSVQSANWGVVCYDLLGVILDNIHKGRIKMAGYETHSRSREMIRLK
ncbi:hypothetical protein Godav_005764 [Gossypium davidsonii]|uniref:Uncharacterized protein n=1 Tax=Gossypium davidsonii TaxID=34287 RepID=A0A7J8S1Q5_GOSDV|nr:hypothetical protein [Gossypium davidsonii]